MYPLQGQQELTTLAESHRVARLQRERFVITRNRLLRAAEIGEDVATVSVDRRALWLQSQCPVEAYQGLRMAAESDLDQAAIVMGFDMAGIELCGALEVR